MPGFGDSEFTYAQADVLKVELEGSYPDAELFSGQTATSALELVVKAPKSFGEPKIVYDGQALAAARRNSEAQPALFETVI